MKVDAILYVKCNHLVPMRCLLKDSKCSWESKYEYCKECEAYIEKKQDELQKDFSSTFGEVDGSENI